MSDPVAVKLKPKHERRIAEGHPWVFSNEIDGDVSKLPPGGVVDVFEAKGRFLGRGTANPRSLISIRLLSRARKEDVDATAFYVLKLLQAKALREAVYPDRRSLRLVFGEADGLPGLVVDRYDDVLAVQITTLGMEVRKAAIQAALEQVFAPRAAVLRNDMKVRELEGLPLHREVWFGEPPEEVTFDESGVTFVLPVLGGQKTGHFFDQHDNKRFAAGLCRGRTVLDVYSNTGGWALHALRAGATSAVCVDKDADNAALCLRNAELNGFGDRLQAIAGEGKLTLQAMVAEGRRFGAVVVDPPAFAKTRKTASSALKGYEDVNALAMTLVEEGGFLFTSSCSHHVYEERLLEAIAAAARGAGRRLQMVRRGEQSSDHPVLPMVPETRYLKSYAFRVTTDV